MTDSGNRTLSLLKAIPVIISLIIDVMGIADVWTVPPQATTFFVLLRLLVLWMIIQDGTILRSRIYSVLLFISGGLFCIGTIFKIDHWPYGNYMLFSGFAISGLFYTVRFALKPSKGLFDWVKWLWVLSCCIVMPFTLFHWPCNDMLRSIPAILLLAMMVIYLRRCWSPDQQP